MQTAAIIASRLIGLIPRSVTWCMRLHDKFQRPLGCWMLGLRCCVIAMLLSCAGRPIVAALEEAAGGECTYKGTQTQATQALPFA